MSNAQPPAASNVPTLVYVFDIKQWNEQLNPLTKLEFVDFIPKICSQFFYDASVPAFILTLAKPKWDSLSDDLKIKYKSITRRLREEVEGPMTQQQRDAYDSSDPFDAFKKRDEAVAAAATASNAQVDNDSLDMSAIEASLNADQ